jgi:hypothetical protein
MRARIAAAVAGLVIGVACVVFSLGETKSVQERNVALEVVRLVQTAETDYFRNAGRYATLAELIKSKQLAQTATGSQENLHAYFALDLKVESDPVPGFVFNLDVPSDSASYKLSVTRPGNCSFSIRTDEKGTVYEDKPSDCEPESDVEPPLAAWDITNLDRDASAVRRDVSCPLSQILQGTSHRARELEENLQKFSAREVIEHLEIGKNGKQRSRTSSLFNYVAEIHESQDGGAYINEYRAEAGLMAGPHPPLADSGTAAFALLFLPHNLEEFSITCEGLTDLDSRSVWQLHFLQRLDRRNDFRAYRVNNLMYPANIKGRAWVAADTFEVLRLESDLLEPIQQINLQTEHLIIEYGPVSFPKREVRLWLPDNVTLFIEYRGRRYERRHRFSNFELFWVDTVQETKGPRLDKEGQIGKY